MAKVFISGSAPQLSALRGVAKDLTDLGFTVVSNWLTAGADRAITIGNPTDKGSVAAERWLDMLSADIIIVFDVTPMCMMEIGAGKAMAHQLVAINLLPDSEDLTLFLPDVDHYPSYAEARRKFFEKPATLRLLRRNNP